MRVTNPNADRSVLACIEVGATAHNPGNMEWFEVPAGESIEVDDYVVASTLVEHGATASPDDLAAARELWAERNRTINSRTASASSSEGEIVRRRQATVDVATGTANDIDKPLAGAALAAAVAEANDAGADIKSSLTADQKRDALAAWQVARGSSTPPSDEFETDADDELILDADDNPIPLGAAGFERHEDGTLVVDEDGRPSPVEVAGDNPEPSDQVVDDATRGDA